MPVTIQFNNLNLDFTHDLRRSLPAAITTFCGAHALHMAIFYTSTDLLARDVLVLTLSPAATIGLGVPVLQRRTGIA